MRILYQNHVDAATLGASPAMSTTLPETNLQDPTRARVARTTSTADQVITGDFTESIVVSAMILWRHNLSGGATVRLQLYSAVSQGGTEVYDSTALDAYEVVSLGDLDFGVTPLADSVYDEWDQYHTEIYFSPATARSFRLTLSDTLNGDGYLEASRLMIGAYFEPSCGPSYGASLAWREDTTQQRTAGGTLRSDSKDPYRALALDLAMIDENDRPHILEARRYCGLRRDLWVTLFPGEGGKKERDHAFIGKFTQTDGLVTPFYAHYSNRMQIEES